MKLDFEITTPERTVFKDEVDAAVIPTKDGEITVLPNHIPLISSILPAGELRLKKDAEEILIMIAGGFLEMRKGNKLVILADAAERAEDIDLERAEQARQRAERMIEEKREEVEMADVRAALARSITRLKIAQRHKSKRRAI